ncbi:DUF4097 family beta strand repeat-containing protein [Kitasatospora sp. NPDC018619]|uniref:DUF4097 family beta strand repeat-containing protein n=1 Tax=unclassified Kitasatospora TaxID=2633591 RepID=UPI0037A0150F
MGAAKAWRITGTLAIVLVVLVAGLQTWSMAVQQRTDSTRPYDVVVHRLRLETGNASVRVRAGQEGHVVVRQRLDWLLRKPVLSTVFEGDVLTVGMHCRLVLPFAEVGCGAEIDLEVPAGTEVSGSVGTGSVQLEGMSGDVRMELTSGQLVLSDTSGEVSVHGTSGLVRGTGLAAPRVSAQLTSGAVELAFARPPHEVEATATSGSVALFLPKDSRYAVSSEIGSGSGRIDPALADSSSPNRVHTAVTSGAVTVLPSAFAPPPAASPAPSASPPAPASSAP